MTTPRNAIDKDELVKLLRGNLPHPDDKKYGCSEMDSVVENHQELILEMAQRCPNITAKLLRDGAIDAYKMKPWECKMFADRMHDALAYCRAKSKSMTSGKKLQPAVYHIAKALRGPPVKTDAADASQKRKSRTQPQLALQDGPEVKVAREESSRAAILALYGMKEAGSSTAIEKPSSSRRLAEQLTISSDDTDLDLFSRPAASKTGSAGSAPSYKEYLDSGLLCLVRLHKDGRVQKAKMAEGPAGFALATFPGEAAIATELPNMMLTVKSEKGNKAMKAKKAMKTMKAMKTKGAMKAMKKKPNKKKKSKKGDDAEDALDDEEGEEEEAEDEEAEHPDEEIEEEKGEDEEEEEEEEKDKEVHPVPPAHPAAEGAGSFDKRYGKMWYKAASSFGIRQRFLAKKQIFTVAHPAGSWTKARLEKIADEAIRKLEVHGLGEGAVKDWVFEQTGR